MALWTRIWRTDLISSCCQKGFTCSLEMTPIVRMLREARHLSLKRYRFKFRPTISTDRRSINTSCRQVVPHLILFSRSEDWTLFTRYESEPIRVRCILDIHLGRSRDQNVSMVYVVCHCSSQRYLQAGHWGKRKIPPTHNNCPKGRLSRNSSQQWFHWWRIDYPSHPRYLGEWNNILWWSTPSYAMVI